MRVVISCEKMSNDESKQNRILQIAKLGGLATLIAGTLANPFVTDTSRDSGIFLYIAQLILKGKMPYVAAWENKGPLIFYINALGLFLTDGSRWGIWLMEFIFLFAAGWVFYKLTKSLFGDLASIFGTFMWILAAGNVLQGGNLSEEYALPFSLAAAWFYWKSIADSQRKLYPILVGVTLGLNILLRPNNIGMHLAIVLAFALGSFFAREFGLLLRRALFIAEGLALVLVPACIYFAARGALTEMFKVAVLFNFQYSDSFNLVRMLNGVADGARGVGLPFVFLSVLGYLFALVDFVNGNSPSRGFLLLLLLSWPIEAVLSTLSGRNYPHYFILWAPHMGLLTAYLVYKTSKLFQFRFEKYAASFLLTGLLIFGFSTRSAWLNYVDTFKAWRTNPTPHMNQPSPLADYIREHTAPEDKVLIWGFRPILYFASQREAPASFLPYPLIHVDTPLGYAWANGFYEQLSANPPVLIVDVVNIETDPIPSLDESLRKTQRKSLFKGYVYAPNLQQVFDFIAGHYVLVDMVEGNAVYRLVIPQ